MAQYGRDAWRANGEVFTAWFGLLGRIAPFALAGPPEAGVVRRRPFGAGLLEPGWSAARRGPRRDRRRLRPLRRAVADAALVRPRRPARGRRRDGRRWRLFLGGGGPAGARRGAPRRDAARWAGGRDRRRRRRPRPDRGGLPRRALPDRAARRRPADRHRGLRPVPAGLGPLRDGLLHADRRPSSRPAWCGQCSWARSSGATCSAPSPATWRPWAAARPTGCPAGELRALRLRQLPLAVLMVALTMTTLWSLGQAIVTTAPAA